MCLTSEFNQKYQTVFKTYSLSSFLESINLSIFSVNF